MIHITLEKQNVPRSMQRLADQSLKQAMIAALVRWRDQVLPEHFEPEARLKYKHHPRSVKYLVRKANAAGQYATRREGYAVVTQKSRSSPDFVFSGSAKRRILAGRREPTGSSKKVTLRLPSPGFFHYRYPGWPHAMRDELTRLTKKELREVLKQVEREMKRHIFEYRSLERKVLA